MKQFDLWYWLQYHFDRLLFMPYIEPSHPPGPNSSSQKILTVASRMPAMHWGKQQNLTVVFLLCFFLSAHGLKGSRDTEAQFAYFLAILALQVYTLISHCMLKSLSGCFFLPEDTYLLDNYKISSSSAPYNRAKVTLQYFKWMKQYAGELGI